MKIILHSLSIMMVVFAMASCKDGKRAKNYNHLIDDGSIAFVQQSLENSQTELKASKLAQANSKNPRVLSFATRVLLDQSVIADGLEQIAITNKIRGGDSISADHQRTVTNMAALKDTAFDKAYIQLMVNNRQRAVKTFSAAATDKTEELQHFARRALPVLRLHLDSANAICADLK